ncbi:MAG: serine hydrolase [Chryseolinea sp.]
MAHVFWRSSKAIYRQGLGCTLIAERSEEDVRGQRIAVVDPFMTGLDAIDWPLGDRVLKNTAPIDSVKLAEVIEEAFAETDPERPKNTSAVLIVHDGRLIAERYAGGYDSNKPHMGWSMTKSITSALIGILVKNGRLSLDNPVPVPEWQGDERRAITLSQLLQASSGLEWTESYFVPTSHFHKMFILRDDKASYAASLPLKHDPGSYFQYSSGTTNILSRLIRQTLGDEAYYKFPYDSLFHPIGMNHALIEPDASGTFVGSSYSFASGRDWARFGLLYLNDGIWNGKRILPEGWVKYTITPGAAALRGEYGAQWHLNAGGPGNPANRKFPKLPTDVYWADGFEDQWIVIVPSHNLVVVRLGVSHHGFQIERLVEDVMASVKDLAK